MFVVKKKNLMVLKMDNTHTKKKLPVGIYRWNSVDD
jgi:hypothetical protein